MSLVTWDKLSAWLESQGLTKRDLADASGVGYLTVLRILAGKVTPSTNTANKLAAGVEALRAVDRVLVSATGVYRLTFFHGRRVYLEHLESGMHGLFWPGIDRTITGARDARGNTITMNSTEVLKYLGLHKERKRPPGYIIRLSSVKGVLDAITASDILARMKGSSLSWISVPVGVLTQICAQYE